MSWARKQIITVQMYRRAAKLSNQEYRQILYEITGHETSRAAGLTQYDFDRLMPALEIRLDLRIANGLVEHPVFRGRRAQLRYWRNRCPGKGQMTTRERHKIFELWEILKPTLDADHQNMKYLTGIAEHAAGYKIRDFWEMKEWQAHLLIEALKDRAAYAIRGKTAA